MYPIRFPGVGLECSINPVAFSVLGKPIYWYGIIIAIGFALAVCYAVREAKRVGLSGDVLMDLILIGAPTAIICARAYYVIFSWDYYRQHLGEIIAIWNGGIAIYGGLIGAFSVAAVYAKVKKISLTTVLDVTAPGFLLAQGIGRWGNFVNQEAFGGVTSLPWRMELFLPEQNAYVAVHPTFLYESLWNLAGFGLLVALRKKKPFDGFIFCAYLLWYGLGRVWIEGLRADSLYLGPLRVSQWLAGACVLICAAVIMLKLCRGKRDRSHQ
ncbi:MAG: prolipoprotein diacylglyceryl transferase [Clostridia bacterium]|nr:prolipoprotein diacylglyceryl transferase [Clostridia bacterium]